MFAQDGDRLTRRDLAAFTSIRKRLSKPAHVLILAQVRMWITSTTHVVPWLDCTRISLGGRRNAEVRSLQQRYIATAERAPTKQLLVLNKLSADGHDTTDAEKQSREFENALATLREPRGLTVDMIAQIDAGIA